MKITINVPAPLRVLAGGQACLRLDLEGHTVGDMFVSLRKKYPALADALFDERGALREHILLFIGEEDFRRLEEGYQAPVAEEITIVVPVTL